MRNLFSKKLSSYIIDSLGFYVNTFLLSIYLEINIPLLDTDQDNDLNFLQQGMNHPLAVLVAEKDQAEYNDTRLHKLLLI